MELADQLAPLKRFAVAYAPAAARPAWIGLFAFEQRLADTAKPGRDALMIQLRLAWWRDRMAQEAALWPRGEPLLAGLHAWDAERPALGALVDGYEAQHVGEDVGAELASARIEAFVALGRLSGVNDPGPIRAAVAQWLDSEPAVPMPTLPRPMRPLAILAGMARRQARGLPDTGLRGFGAALRLGLTGR